jgi:antirestriction protein ArdC
MAKSRKSFKTGQNEGPTVEEKVQQLVEVLDEGVKNFRYTEEDFKALLEMKALMPNYSFRNLLVAKAQYPNGSFFASFQHWKKLGRFVKKGESHQKIFKPVFKKVTEEDCGEEKEFICRWMTVPVFAYEQTDGEDLPIEKLNLKLEGDCIEARQIIQWAEAIAANDDCPVSYGNANGANGYYVPSKHEIVVDQSLSINQRCKTLVHELVHSKVHRHSRASTSEKEVVAEGTAFVICRFFGLDTSGYSFRYVKSWSEGDQDSLIKYGNQICDTAKEIIQQFQEQMENTNLSLMQTA